MKKQKLLRTEELEKRKNMKFFKLLHDEDFWERLNLVSLSSYRISRLREYRTKMLIPSKKFLSDFINEDYRLITKDERETREIILDFLSDKACEENTKEKS